MDIKQKLEQEIMESAERYLKENQCEELFAPPLVGYADATHPLFTEFYERDLSAHPKEIYRPGQTIIVHFVPFRREYIESSRHGDQISKEWITAYERSIMLSARINTTILEFLEDMGRLASLAASVTDWDDEACRPKWSHKLAAFAAGMGQFEIAGFLKTEAGVAGRFSSVITEFPIEPSKAWDENSSAFEICDEILRRWGFRGTPGVKHEASVIGRCPANAIFEDGIDRTICQAFCAKQGQTTPVPEVCGKCLDL